MSALLRSCAVVVCALSACKSDAVPECASGEFRYSGRPPERLFNYETECRADCFSPAVAGSCDQSCDPINVSRPAGFLSNNDHQLTLIDAASLGDGIALLYRFGYVDEAEGDAPENWSLLGEPATYLSNQIRSTARFVVQAVTVAFHWQDTDAGSTFVVDSELAEAIDAAPGRLELYSVDARGLRGIFYVSFPSSTGQLQSQVNGCFELPYGDAVGEGALSWRPLGARLLQ